MSVFGNILNIFRRADAGGEAAPTKSPVDIDGEAYLRAVSMLQSGGAHVSDSQAMRLSTVYACVDKISSTVAKLPLEPYKILSDGSRALDRSSVQYEMLCFTPNAYCTRFDFFKLVVVSYLLKGNAFIYLVRNQRTGVAEEMHVWLPQDVTVVLNQSNTRITEYYNSRLDISVRPSEVAHIKNFTYDGLLGVSTLEHARRSLGLANSAEVEATRFFNKGAGGFGVLSSDKGRLTKEQKDDIRASWRAMVNSTDSKGSVAVLEQGLQYQQISVNPVDAQLLETRKFSVPEICRFFDVSPVKVHDLSKSSYSTVEAVNIDFLNDTMTPHLTRIELELRRKIYPRNVRKNMVVDFDTSDLIRGDSNAQANLYSRLSTIGAMTPNEVRDRFKMPRIEGGDDAYMQINMQRLKDFDTKANYTSDGR